MNHLIRVLLLVILVSPSLAQWTAPEPINLQPGPGAKAPWISNDGLRLYFSGTASLAVMTRVHPDSAWNEWHELPLHINSTPTQQCPAESPSGDTLYFIGDPRLSCDNFGLWDVYYTVRNDTGWGPVQNAGSNVSSPRREFSVGISRDGSTLLVASNRFGIYWADLYYHEKQEDGTWGQAIRFGPEINDVNEGDEHASLSPDGNRLYYRRDGFSLNEIYRSTKSGGIWQLGSALPSPPNNWQGITWDEDPCIAADGRTLYFVQAADSGDHLYRIVTSVDTTVAAISTHPSAPAIQSPELTITTDTSGNLRLVVTGTVIHGAQQVEVHDILGRRVGMYMQQFTASNGNSVANAPPLTLPSGTYIVSLQLFGGTLSAKYIRAK